MSTHDPFFVYVSLLSKGIYTSNEEMPYFQNWQNFFPVGWKKSCLCLVFMYISVLFSLLTVFASRWSSERWLVTGCWTTTNRNRWCIATNTETEEVWDLMIGCELVITLGDVPCTHVTTWWWTSENYQLSFSLCLIFHEVLWMKL